MVSNQQTADTQEVEEQSTVLVDSIESAQLQPEQNEAGAEEIVKLKDVKQIIVYLAKEFPNCFTSEGEAKPLKIGIFKELAERVEPEGIVSRTQLRQALRRYTSSWRYLKSIAKGGVRIDLDGKPGDKVEQDHIDHAAKALEESKAKFEASRKTLKDKKIYKKSQKDTGENSSKQTKFNNSKQRAAGKSYVTSKAGGSKSGKSARKQPEKKAPAVELSPLTDQLNKPGTQVMVKLGQSPVPGVIREVAKGVIHVELNSGMVVKTTFENIFVA